MNKYSATCTWALAAFCAASTATMAVPAPAQAGDFQGMTCSELWYERNSIYAENGFCFQTARARAEFGKACFAPYGKLSSSEQQTVKYIKQAERKKHCS